MPVSAQLRVLSISKGSKKRSDLGDWQDVHIQGLVSRNFKKEAASTQLKLFTVPRIYGTNLKEKGKGQCVLVTPAPAARGFKTSPTSRRALISPKVAKHRSKQQKSDLGYSQKKALKKIHSNLNKFASGLHVSTLYLEWVAPRAAFTPLSKELREVLRLNPVSAELMTYPSNVIPHRENQHIETLGMLSFSDRNNDVGLGSRPQQSRRQNSKDQEASWRRLGNSPQSTFPQGFSPSVGGPKRSQGGNTDLLRTCKELLEVDVCATVPFDLWVKRFDLRLNRYCNGSPCFGTLLKNPFYGLLNLLHRSIPKAKGFLRWQSRAWRSGLVVAQPATGTPTHLSKTLGGTKSSTLERRVWVRLRFHRQRDMLRFLKWYVFTAAVPPMATDPGMHPSVKEAATAFVQKTTEHQSVYEIDSPTDGRTTTSKADEVAISLMKPSRQWEYYLRPRWDHNHSLYYSASPLYLWQSFMPLAKCAFYGFERGFLRIECYYAKDRLPQSSTFRRGRPKEKCDEIRKGSDVNVTRVRSQTSEMAKRPTGENSRAVFNKASSIHSAFPPHRFGKASTKKSSSHYNNSHTSNPGKPKASEEMRRSFTPYSFATLASKQHALDTISIHSDEKAGEEACTERTPREHNEFNKWDKVCFTDIFLCISEYYLLFYDSFGRLKYHLKLDDVSAIFSLQHPSYPMNSVETANASASTAHEPSSKGNPPGYPFIRFKANTGGDVLGEPTLSVTFTFLPFVPFHRKCLERDTKKPCPSTHECVLGDYRDDVWKRQRNFLAVLRKLKQHVKCVDMNLEDYTRMRSTERLQRRSRNSSVNNVRDLMDDTSWQKLYDSQKPSSIVQSCNSDLVHEGAEVRDGAARGTYYLKSARESVDWFEVREDVQAGASSPTSPIQGSLVLDKGGRMFYDIYATVSLAAPLFLPIDEKEIKSPGSWDDASRHHNKSEVVSQSSIYNTDLEYFEVDLPNLSKTPNFIDLFCEEVKQGNFSRDERRGSSSSSEMHSHNSMGSGDNNLPHAVCSVFENRCSKSRSVDSGGPAESLFEPEPGEFVPIKPKRRNSLLQRKRR